MMSVAELLPQKPPMVLLSGYEPQTEAQTVTACVEITPDAPFFERELGGVPACVALEYMAQTMALLVGLLRRQRGEPPKIGFVLGSRRLEILVPFFAVDERYRVTASCGYEDDSFGSFDCRITDAAGNVLARGTLTAFQPEGDELP